jgi:hypothetical protein
MLLATKQFDALVLWVKLFILKLYFDTGYGYEVKKKEQQVSWP